jgi:type 1 glutamine amidotransferase
MRSKAVIACLSTIGLAWAGSGCADGSGNFKGTGGMVVTPGTGGNTTPGTGGSTNGTGGNVDPPGSGGATSSGGSSATGGTSGGGSTGTGGGATSSGGSAGTTVATGGRPGTGGMVAGTGGMVAGTGGAVASPFANGPRSGPFKVLVLSKCLEFTHDSIATGQTMLRNLGMKTDAQLPMGATAGSQFTITIAKDDLSDFTDANLQQYQLLFWMNPTGTIFSSGGAAGRTGMMAVQKYIEGGGSWAGVHSATDFEKTGGWNWFLDFVGGYFVRHDNPGTSGTVTIQAPAISMNHPAIRGMPNPWNANEEWYYMNRDPSTLPGFVILAKLSSDSRPVAWSKEVTGGGRMFYTIRGHDRAAYNEPDFQRLVHQGILWAVHRMQ